MAVLAFIAVKPGFSEQQFVFKVGGMYEQGNFGTPDNTRVFFVPVTFRYATNQFSLSLTPSFGWLDTVSGTQLIDGIPVQIQPGADGIQESLSGVGDTVLKARLFLTDGGRSRPAITPFFKVKLATGDAAKGLSTGETDYGFGFEIDHQIRSFMLFGDIGYTVIGDMPGFDLRNRIAGSIGIARRLAGAGTGSILVNWRRALVPGNDDPVELFGVLTRRLNSVASISPNILVGLSKGSPSFGAGVELTFRLGSLD